MQYFGGVELQWFQDDSNNVRRYLPLEVFAVRAGGMDIPVAARTLANSA